MCSLDLAFLTLILNCLVFRGTYISIYAFCIGLPGCMYLNSISLAVLHAWASFATNDR